MKKVLRKIQKKKGTISPKRYYFYSSNEQKLVLFNIGWGKRQPLTKLGASQPFGKELESKKQSQTQTSCHAQVFIVMLFILKQNVIGDRFPL